MRGLSSSEQEAVERAAAEPMLDQVLGWAAVNSGSRNLAGLERMADLLADAFAALPGVLRLEQPQPVEAVDPNGRKVSVGTGAISTSRSGRRRRCSCSSPATWTRCSPPTTRSRRRAGSRTACSTGRALPT